MSNRAWVTLATNDSYGLGALVLAHSLRRAGSSYPAVVLITPSVTEAMRDRLRAVFAEVVIVDVLDSKDAAHLALLQRPELGITFTKIHCWNLTQYEKCVFLDADTLIVQNCDELFEREELSAAPDVGWPDCFNTGVFVFKPSAETFDSLIKFAQERGSFDGGDQGLLNSYFSDWAHGDINKHLPFLYNVTSAAFYSYLPALKHYGQNLKIIHFIGAAKPWLQQFNWETRTSEAPQHLKEFLQLWWDTYVAHVHSVLDSSMVDVEEALPATTPQEPFFHTEPRLDYCHYEPVMDPQSEFPWHHPDAQLPETGENAPEIDMTQFHDPWDIYRGNIPPNVQDSSPRHIESQRPDDHEEMRKYAWDYMPPQHYQPDAVGSDIWKTDPPQNSQHENVDYTQRNLKENVWEYNPQHDHNPEQHYSQSIAQNTPQNSDHYQSHTKQYNLDSSNEYSQDNTQQHSQKHFSEYSQQDTQSVYSHSHIALHEKYDHIQEPYYPTQQNRVQHVYYIHLDHEKVRDRQHCKHESDGPKEQPLVNGYGEDDNEIFENLLPRHPYDGFYLRHRMTIDSRGHKVCTHEVPPTPTPSPPESPLPEENSLLPFEDTEEEEEPKQSSDPEGQTGVAGNFARMVLGAGAQREALDDLTRRQGWEAGNIDYMGADAFDNIWAKISQTLSQPRPSPPKQSSPPQQAEAPPVQQVVESPPVPAPVAVPAPETAPISAPIPIPAAEPEPVKPAVEPVKEAEVPAPKVQAAEPVKAPVPAAVPESAKVIAAEPTQPKPAAEAPAAAPTPVAAPVAPTKPITTPPSTPEVQKDAAPIPLNPPSAVKPVPSAAAPSKPKTEVTPVKAPSATDSPPLANTPSKESLPAVPAAKSEERHRPAGLQLPAAAADALPTPDSELEDAAALAHAIIAGEAGARSPSAGPAPAPPSPSPPPKQAVSLSQIGVEPQPKTKSTIAAQIESSVTEVAEAPKKKVVKKVLKKDGGEAPVPPPRKKEKKPKDK